MRLKSDVDVDCRLIIQNLFMIFKLGIYFNNSSNEMIKFYSIE